MGFILCSEDNDLQDVAVSLAKRRFLSMSTVPPADFPKATIRDALAVLYVPSLQGDSDAVARACALQHRPLLMLSDESVLGNIKGTKPCDETCDAVPESEDGALYYAHEQAVKQACAQHIILRCEKHMSPQLCMDALWQIAGAAIQDGFQDWGVYHWGSEGRLATTKAQTVFGLGV